MAGGLGSPSLGLCKRGDFEISHGVVGSKTGGIQHFWRIAPNQPQACPKSLPSCTVVPWIA